VRDEGGGDNVDMVCAHISKYGNIDNHKVKIAVKYAKNQKKMRDKVGGLVDTWSVCTFPNMVTLAIINKK
jgi:hypothetical protein